MVFIEVFRLVDPKPGRHVVFPNVLADQQPVEGLVAPAELVERELVVPTGAANFFRWAGPAAIHANRNGRHGCRQQYFFYPHLVLPVVAEVVGVGEFVVDLPREIA